MKIIIKEVIVVEGRDDVSAVKAAVDAEVFPVHGFSIRKGSNLEKLRVPYENKGLIVLTDPDYAGEQIRRGINERFPNCKNAYITRAEGSKSGDVGVENATPEAIINALLNAKSETIDKVEDEYIMSDLIDNGLNGGSDSTRRRELLCGKLSLGYSNSKQLLSKLNRYSIKREDFLKAIDEINKM